ncbi:MAG: metal-dependent phosphohydrolase [Candidatus Cloacimonadota bacterium]|nr:MAG: metal-dependent phosphohydrolase [Candidatus Cloacimonadota bacterium]
MSNYFGENMENLMNLSQNKRLNSLLNKVVNEVNDYGKEQLKHIKSLTNIGIALSAERRLSYIFELILNEAVAYTNADGATIYSVSNDGHSLRFEFVLNRSMNLKMGGRYSNINWPPVLLKNEDGSDNKTNAAAIAVINAESYQFEDIYHQDVFDCSGSKKFDKMNNYRSKSMVAIPLKNHENKVLGVIQLINAQDHEGHVISFTDEHIAMLKSLASQAAISLSNRVLINDLKKLLYEMIQAIAEAIDSKSPYTGGHITRVAKLTEAIADKIQTSDSGFYKDIKFNHDELEEIKLSGWVHDLGKITTPLHVMDKATKLQTIFDRIELVMSRFDTLDIVLDKDIEISELKGLDDKSTELKRLKEKVKEYRIFTEKLNIGGEFLRDEDLNYLKEILDFSYESSGRSYFIINEDEFKNLSIRKGTLLPEEIDIMREHVVITKKMLSKISFPEKLKNVPDYAASHHEKLNGSGYPGKLTENELPLQSRIIAIADLYEALTASDRPYKKGKTLSETFKILAFMVKDNDIDANLLDLLIDTGLYLEYAEKYLPSRQIDDVDFEKIRKIYKQ